MFCLLAASALFSQLTDCWLLLVMSDDIIKSFTDTRTLLMHPLYIVSLVVIHWGCAAVTRTHIASSMNVLHDRWSNQTWGLSKTDLITLTLVWCSANIFQLLLQQRWRDWWWAWRADWRTTAGWEELARRRNGSIIVCPMQFMPLDRYKITWSVSVQMSTYRFW